MSRYVVTEIEGYTIGAEGKNRSNRLGLSVQVLDRAYNHRIVKAWRSEDYHAANGLTAFVQVRLRARVACKALNAGQSLKERSLGRTMRRGAMKPPSARWTCPSCGDWKTPAARTCMGCRSRP